MKNRWFWIAFGGAAATTILACWASWILMIQPMDASVKTANALEEIFSREFGITPRLSANAGVLFSQKSRVENLIAANRTITVQLTIDMPLADGNQPKLSADFVCEAGIAGRDPIEINIRRGGCEADITLPKPKILSLDMSAAPIVEPPGPPWDSLPENARTRAERQLRLTARQQLLDEGLLSQADLDLRSRISKLAAKADCEAIFSSKP